MPIITIRGQLGSGAPEIGRLIAERLHLDYVDREIIAEVATRLQRREQDVLEKEMPPGSLFGRIAEALTHGYFPGPGSEGRYLPAYLPTWEFPLDDARYIEELEFVIRKLATSKSIVVRGRGSQFILKDWPETIHILIIASPELRLARVMENQGINKDAAKREIQRFDNSRREFIKRYFKAELEDPKYYDLVINTQNLSYDATTSIIIQTLTIKASA